MHPQTPPGQLPNYVRFGRETGEPTLTRRQLLRSNMPCRVLLADDHQIVRQGVRALLERAGHLVVGEAADGREAWQLAQTLQPAIAVLDLAMPLLNGLDAIAEIHRVSPNTKTILLTMHSDRPYVLQALRAGVKGYVVKTQTSDDLIRAIQEVLRGAMYLSPEVAVSLADACLHKGDGIEEPLTARERQILQLIAESKTTKGVASLLGISVKTAECHRNRIMNKLSIHDTAGLVRYAIRRGLLQP